MEENVGLRIGILYGSRDLFYLTTDEYGVHQWNDSFIIRMLNMQPHKFYKILNKHKGIYDYDFSVCFFKKKSDAEKAFDELDPIIIMNKLMGE